ncbi:DUF5810 domain-containing protein [Natrarchaeobaculum aegyptiacum]|uniref:Uncharacterized protein n=1 Tax=Natrarchaeobaculum aegyptiacum TaxID=745377 RepID=A0A2Z2HS12_9EURY|nr:DUF5810 domain-containing protein [Natrarchaeobaculum aegyptiacum]ARS89981.1 hypothetical protein B1756_09740 [Natrarchaeobaculum aegyptiacum]
MGYACPVCGVEQPDAAHLANHLAVTASLGREDHEEWLAERVPDWGEMGPTELGDRLTEYAPAVDTPDPVTGPEPSPQHGRGHDHGHSHAHDHDGARPSGLEDALAHQSRQPGRGSLSAEARGALEEARELTRQMYESGSDATSDAESTPDPADGGDAGGDGTASDETGTANENA